MAEPSAKRSKIGESAELLLNDYPIVTLTETESRATVGRRADRGHDWHSDHKCVSGTHFVLEFIHPLPKAAASGRELYIQDQSSHGTFVNQTRIESQKKVQLYTGDQIDFVNLGAWQTAKKTKDREPPPTLRVRIRRPPAAPQEKKSEALDETLAAGKYKYDKRVEQSFAKPELISARAYNAEKGKEKARKRLLQQMESAKEKQ